MIKVVTACLAMGYTFSTVAAVDDDADTAWVCLLDHDSGTSRKLFAVPQALTVNGLAVTTDGQTLAYSALPLDSTGLTEARIWTCDAAGENLRDLGRGTQPSWSPGGMRLVFSRPEPEPGVWLMRSDGSDQQILDARGWGATWSPNGLHIAWLRTVKGQTTVVLYDIAEDDFTLIVGEGVVSDASRNALTWSPNRQRLGVLSVNDGGIGRFYAFNALQPDDGRVLFERKVAGQSVPVWLSGESIIMADKMLSLVADSNQQQVASTLIDGFAEGRRNTVACVRGASLLYYISQPLD